MLGLSMIHKIQQDLKFVFAEKFQILLQYRGNKSYIGYFYYQMSKNIRKNSLDMLAHKNREEILLYISQAKIQIYSHYLIAYDSQFYSDTMKSQEIAELYKIYDESENALTVRKDSMGSDTSENNGQKDQTQGTQKKQDEANENNENQKKFTSLFISITSSQLTELRAPVTEGMTQKIIYFNNPDLAFYIDQSQKKIQIHNLTQKTLELCFSVQKIETLMAVQTMFRKKICELGFFRKYKSIKRLGKGATADVYLVQRIADKKLFAAKIISIKKSNQKQFELFINQAKLLRILKHKNIINLESVYIHKKQLIQVLEYLPCGNLLQILKKNQFTSHSQKWKALKDIAQALEFLRQRRIVHRDLKLQNIMIRHNSNSRQFVLSDFGLACWTGNKNPIYQRCGTPGYIAPQVLNYPRGQTQLDHRSDIFSLGVIAHLLFLHEPLFHFRGCLKQLITLNKKAEFNLNDKFHSQLPIQQLNFLTMTLQKKIENRPSADVVLRLLNTLINQEVKVSPEKVKRKISLETDTSGVEVEIKKQATMTKKTIQLDFNLSNKSKQSPSESSPDVSPIKRSFANSAKKAVSDFIRIFTESPKKKVETLKIKENSVEKQRKMSDFLN